MQNVYLNMLMVEFFVYLSYKAKWGIRTLFPQDNLPIVMQANNLQAPIRDLLSNPNIHVRI